MTADKADQDIRAAAPSEMPAHAQELLEQGYRIEQICGMSKDGVTDLLYSFAKDRTLISYKATVPEDMTVPSITNSYWAAFIFENEIHDLFGVIFTGLVLDYKGNFFRLAQPTPQRTYAKKEGS